MDKLIEQITPQYMSASMIDTDTFIESFKKNNCELIDIRMDFEREIYNLQFGLNIPLNELAKRQDEIPSNKQIVLACPTGPRSIIGWTYLKSKGYDVVFLKGGLDGLLSTLKGSKAKEFLE